METGSNIKMKPYEGFNYPIEFVGNVADHLQQIKNMHIRPDDVFITSYPKAGTHWAYEITYMLLHGKPEYCRKHHWLDIDTMDDMNNAVSPRIFITHIPINRLPSQLLEGRAKIINISRNPKDLIVSYYCYVRSLAGTAYDGQLDLDFVRRFLEGDVPYDSWFRSIQAWTEFPRTHPHAPILYLNYEEMKKDLYPTVMKTAEFLGVTADKGLMEAIVDKCQFSNTQRDKTVNLDPRFTHFSRDSGQILYRKGEVGDWKNWFTVAINEEFDRIYNEKMKNIDVQFQFTI